MSNLGTTNEHGQGASHATQSSVPGKIQEKAPSSVEVRLFGRPCFSDNANNCTAQAPG